MENEKNNKDQKTNEDPTLDNRLYKRATAILKHRTLLSMGAGLIPIPILDIAAVTSIQLDLIRDLSRIYQLDYSENYGKDFVTALSGGVLARLGASAIKLLPGVGTLLGAVSMSVLSGASTYAIGMLTIENFSNGKDIRDLRGVDLADRYNEYFKEGKGVVKDWKKEEEKKEEEKAPESKEVVARLKEVAELKEMGTISEEEFQKMKEKLLAEYLK